VNRAAQSLLAVLVVSACAGSDGADGESGQPACLPAAAPLDCQPLYGLRGGAIAPTFDEIHANTLSRCASAGCHTGGSPAGGLDLTTPDGAHDALVGAGRITPSDLRCGDLIVRLETPGEPWSMPFGSHLDEAELCVLRHWIDQGAAR